MGMFDSDLKNLKNMQKFYQRAPKQYGHAARGLQNSAAFNMRNIAIMTVGRMTNRAEKFNRSRLKVKKANGTNIDRMAAIIGSIKSLRHTGWVEQESGKRQIRRRSQTLDARGGSWQRKVSPSARLKPSTNMLDPEKDGIGKNKEQRLSSLLSQIKAGNINSKRFKTRKRYKGKLKSLSRGVFQYRYKKIIRLQRFERPKQPKRRPWMKPARELLGKKFNIAKEWEKQVTQQLKFIK